MTFNIKKGRRPGPAARSLHASRVDAAIPAPKTQALVALAISGGGAAISLEIFPSGHYVREHGRGRISFLSANETIGGTSTSSIR